MLVKSNTFLPIIYFERCELKIQKFQLANDQVCLFFSTVPRWTPQISIKVNAQ